MKKFFITVLFAFIAICAFAQKDIPAGMRMEVAEVEENNREYSIFTYKDEDGTLEYYLSLGRVFRLLEIAKDDVPDMSLSQIDEACICLGATAEEAFASIDSILELFNADLGTTKEFPSRLTTGADRLGAPSTATCIVVKRFLQGKRLSFTFIVKNHTGHTDLTKSAVKSLKGVFKFNQKLHPNG